MARLVLCGALALTLVASAQAATIRVPDDQPTIQAGIVAAVEGDTVLVAPGVYTGTGNVDLDFLGKDLVLTSESGPEMTAVDGEALWGTGPRAIAFTHGETRAAIVDGLTFRRCSAPAPYLGGAIFCTGASPTIRNCIFEHNYADSRGGAIFLQGSAAEIRDCRFLGNWATSAGGAIACHQATPNVSNSTFMQNGANYGGGAFYTWAGSVTLDGCRFTESGDSQCLGSALEADHGTLSATSCLFDRNAGSICIFVNDADVQIAESTLVLNGDPPNATSGVSAEGDASVSLDNTILAFGLGVAFRCADFATIDLTCCDVFGNDGGDWVDCVADQLGVNGNISQDPLFCDLPAGDFTLQTISPCAPEHSGPCGLIGAFPVHCGAVAVEAATWGEIKARYR